MDDLGARLSALETTLPRTRPPSLADLRAVFESDRELFFGLVAVNGDGTTNSLRMLARLARITAVLMRDGFEMATRANQYIAEGARGGFLPITDYEKDGRLLQQLWSKSYLAADRRGLESAKGSAAEEQFFYGDFDWVEPIRAMRLLRVDPMDAAAVVGGLPPYHKSQLIDCAREVVACPRIIGEGLRGEGPLKKGRAYYGKPQRRWLNDGTCVDPPPDMLFAVYADADGSVYDWDWKCAAHCDPAQPPTPTTPRFRAANPSTDVAELIVGNVIDQEPKPFRPGHPWYSVAGDCVFCYFENREAYEERVDEFLTRYMAFDSHECIGLKLKYVSRLLNLVEKWSKQDDESIVVHVQLDTVEVDLEFLMRAWLMKSLPKRLPLSVAMKLIQYIEQRPEKVVIPREAVERAYDTRSLAHLQPA